MVEWRRASAACPVGGKSTSKDNIFWDNKMTHGTQSGHFFWRADPAWKSKSSHSTFTQRTNTLVSQTLRVPLNVSYYTVCRWPTFCNNKYIWRKWMRQLDLHSESPEGWEGWGLAGVRVQRMMRVMERNLSTCGTQVAASKTGLISSVAPSSKQALSSSEHMGAGLAVMCWGSGSPYLPQ